MADYGPLEQIKRKCEQYWNENHIGVTEVHAMLAFIHVRAAEVKAEVERLKDENHRLSGGAPILAEKERLNRESQRHVKEVERLEATDADQFDRFRAVLKQRDDADAEVERLKAAAKEQT